MPAELSRTAVFTMVTVAEDFVCTRRTGGSCWIYECDDWRGDVVCEDHACLCAPGFTGSACQYLLCPSEIPQPCNGHGQCKTMEMLARTAGFAYREDVNDPYTWDAGMVRGCDCDAGFAGYDCSLKTCAADCSGAGTGSGARRTTGAR